jgi:SWI/SNF-related matrix-associated actin-dependent regulator of chromatin subfamily A member 5
LRLKDEILATGFRDWNKLDFNNFITGNEKYGRKNFEQISQLVGKSQLDVEKYSLIFWARIDELSEKDRILKQIQNG